MLRQPIPKPTCFGTRPYVCSLSEALGGSPLILNPQEDDRCMSYTRETEMKERCGTASILPYCNVPYTVSNCTVLDRTVPYYLISIVSSAKLTAHSFRP